MVRKSRGPRRKTRKKMLSKGKININDYLRTFEVGDKVHVNLRSNVKGKGYPYIMFHGLTGEIIEKRGASYVVQVRDKNALKSLMLSPVHLKRAG